MQCLFVYETHYRLQGSADGFKDALTLEGRLLNVTMLVYQQQLVEFEFFPVHSRAPAWQILQFAVSGLVPYFTAVEQEPKLLILFADRRSTAVPCRVVVCSGAPLLPAEAELVVSPALDYQLPTMNIGKNV